MINRFITIGLNSGCPLCIRFNQSDGSLQVLTSSIFSYIASAHLFYFELHYKSCCSIFSFITFIKCALVLFLARTPGGRPDRGV